MHYFICRLDFHEIPVQNTQLLNKKNLSTILTHLSLVTKMVVKTANTNLLNDLYVHDVDSYNSFY